MIDGIDRPVHQLIPAIRSDVRAGGHRSVALVADGPFAWQVRTAASRLLYQERLSCLAAFPNPHSIVEIKLEGVGGKRHVPNSNHMRFDREIGVSFLEFESLFHPLTPLHSPIRLCDLRVPSRFLPDLRVPVDLVHQFLELIPEWPGLFERFLHVSFGDHPARQVQSLNPMGELRAPLDFPFRVGNDIA